MTEQIELKKKPKATNSLAERELDKAEEQFKAFDDNVKSLTLDRMNQAPKEDVEPQTKIATRDMDKNNIYLKPHKTIGSREKFNEKFRDDYNFMKEYVCFIAENKEIVGETIELWTKKFPGVPAEMWQVPVNKPVWGPRYLAEQIKSKSYHRLIMDQSKKVGETDEGVFYGQMAVDKVIQRLDAYPATTRRSIFMGAA